MRRAESIQHLNGNGDVCSDLGRLRVSDWFIEYNERIDSPIVLINTLKAIYKPVKLIHSNGQ